MSKSLLNFAAITLATGALTLGSTASAWAAGHGAHGCQPAPARVAAPPAAATAQNGRQTYRSYSYGPSAAPQYAAPVYSSPMMRRSGPSSVNRFRADRKIRGNY